MRVRPTPNTNGPKAAIAPVQPITPPACRRSKIIGICLKVDALPIPANRKIASMPQRNWLNPACSAAAEDVSGVSAGIVQMMLPTRPRPEISVQIAPPMRSVSGENSTRAPAPTSGPRNTKAVGSGTW
jgi:hypothetical protein